MLDDDACYRALKARDARFDGRFFVGVSTTGIYCRPICTARLPGRDRCSFHASAAAAEKAGFRACFRCRPELAPGSASVDAVPRLVARALAKIQEGYLDHAGVDALAAELEVSDRHLRRALEAELGVSPVELAQTRRLAVAKQLLHDSTLSLTAIAFASGFGSVRRFNASVLARFGRPPSELRRVRAGTETAAIVLRLDHRPPLEFPALLEFLAARAIPGIERVEGDRYIRRIRTSAGAGEVRVGIVGGKLRAELDATLAPVIPKVIAGLRRLFDLDAEPTAIAAVLGGDPLLAPLVRRRPGLRVPGSFDPFETAIRAVLGQQVSVAAATTLAGRLVARFDAVPSPRALARTPAATLAGALGLPLARAQALVTLASAWDRGAIGCEPGSDPDALAAALVELPGIGPWTAAYLCMRALHFPDALPAGDLVLRKALGVHTTARVTARAEAWRPWRAYAAIHLWTAVGRGEL